MLHHWSATLTSPWLPLATIALLVCLLSRQRVRVRVLSWVGQAVLPHSHPIRDSRGKPIQGPPWQWPDGQMVDKFLAARQCSLRWHRYGPVYRIWASAISELVITTPGDVKQFYSDGHQHRKAESSNAGWLFRQVLGQCVGLLNGRDWRRVRSHIEFPLSYRATMARLDEILHEAHDYLQGDFLQYADKSTQDASCLIVNPVHALQWKHLRTKSDAPIGTIWAATEKNRVTSTEVEPTCRSDIDVMTGQTNADTAHR
ncbi:Cytochrome P450 monooxygenase sirC [Metarhizium anisopliae]